MSSDAWVIAPRYPTWGFDSPREDLVKVQVGRSVVKSRRHGNFFMTSEPRTHLLNSAKGIGFDVAAVKSKPCGGFFMTHEPRTDLSNYAQGLLCDPASASSCQHTDNSILIREKTYDNDQSPFHELASSNKNSGGLCDPSASQKLCKPVHLLGGAQATSVLKEGGECKGSIFSSSDFPPTQKAKRSSFIPFGATSVPEEGEKNKGGGFDGLLGGPHRPTQEAERQQHMDKFFGDPLLQESSPEKWQPTYHIRATGEVVLGAAKSTVPLPFNVSRVCKSVAVIARENSLHDKQSGLWIGPRLLLSSLCFHDRDMSTLSDAEVDAFHRERSVFHVESEPSSQLLSEDSPKVELLCWSAKHEIAILKLQKEYPSVSDWVDPGWLMERDELYGRGLKAGREVACMAFTSDLSQRDMNDIWYHIESCKTPQLFSFTAHVECLFATNRPDDRKRPIFNSVLKPQVRSFAPGTVDMANADPDRLRLGVSSSLFKGSGGGPCILLDEFEAGGIIGLVRGAADELGANKPYNLVSGFPNGLKDQVRKLEEGLADS